MKKIIALFFGLTGTFLFLVLFIYKYQPAYAANLQQYNTPIPPTPAAERFYTIDLERASADSPQLERGKEVYRLVCSACHAYDGSGFTAEWISTWDPADQNCWQSKCHGPNHPEDGFEIPRWAPPVAGPNKLAPYATAKDYFNYIDQNMPWYVPGTVVEEQIWDVTAYLLSLNKIELDEEELNAKTAESVVLNAHLLKPQNQPSPTASILPTASNPAAAEGPQPPFPWWLLILLPAAAGVIFILALINSRKKDN